MRALRRPWVGLWIPYLAIAAGIAAGAFIWTDYHREVRALRERGRRSVELTARVLQRPLWNLATDDVEAVLETLMLDPDVAGAVVLDVGGTVAARWRGRVYERPAERRELIPFASPIVHGSRSLGTLRLYYSPKRLHRRLALRLAGGLLLVGAGIASMILYGEFLVGQWLRNRWMSRRLLQQQIQSGHVLESLEVATYVARPDGTVLFRQGPWDRWRGCAGKLRWGDWVHPDDRARARQWFREAAAGSSPSFTDYRVELGSGEVRWVRDWVRRDARRVYGLIQDITEARLAEQARQELERRMAEAQRMESLGRLASGLAHDFRNLIHLVRGHIDLLERGFPPEQCVPPAREALGQASSLVRSLLDLARTDIPRSAQDLGRVLARTVELARPAMGSGTRLRLERPPAPVWAEVGTGEIQQALLNLIMNARDAVGENGEIRVRLEAVREAGGVDPGSPGHAVISVEDDGPGIPEHVMPPLFEPFFTTKPPGIGTGLGLATVYRIVHLHGGTVHVESQEGGGARFELRIPLVPEPPLARPAGDTRAPEPGPTAPPGRNGNAVLIVDDEPAIRRAYERLVEGMGMEPVAVGNGTEAVARFQEAPECFAAAVLDVELPGLRGTEVLHRLRARRPDIPVILATGLPPDPDELADQGHAVEVLVKPFDMGELDRALRRVVGRPA